MRFDLLINRGVVDALRKGKIAVCCNRRSGKTETLLAYIAVNDPRVPSGKGAIIVAETLRDAQLIRTRWRLRYPELPEPRFMSKRQNFIGLRGIVFTDEIDDMKFIEPFLCDDLIFGGGVCK
jgi:hypothetical protein